MTTVQDCSIGIGVESTWGTGVTPTRWFEFADESFDWRKNIKQGRGLRVGSRVARSGRRVIPTADGGGDLTVECISKGMGLLWQALLGSGTSTLVSGSTYQQNFTFADSPSGITLQKGVPETGGTVDPYTFTGGTCDSWELDFPNADIVTLKSTWDFANMATATAYTAPSYATSPNLFHFNSGTVYTGTLTAPTTTALASGTTQVMDVRGGSISVDNDIASDRYNLVGTGRKSRQLVQGVRKITGKLDVEYDATTFRDAVINDTPMALILTWSAGALSTGLETLQVVIPEIKFDSEMPKTNGGQLVKQSLSFEGLDNLSAAQPMWVVMRTADSAL